VDTSASEQRILFDVIRQLRNRTVHGAGVVDSELEAARKKLSQSAPGAENRLAEGG